MNRSIFSEAEPAQLTPHETLVQSLREIDQELEGVEHDYRMLSDTNGYGVERNWTNLNNILGGPAKNPTSVMCLQRHFSGKVFPLCADRLEPPHSQLGLPERQRVLDQRRERLDDMRATVRTLMAVAALARPAAGTQLDTKQYEMTDLNDTTIGMVAMLEKLTFPAGGWTRESLKTLLAAPEWKTGQRDLQVFRDPSHSRHIGHFATTRARMRIPYTRSILATPVEKVVLRVDTVGIAAGYRDHGTELIVHRLIQDLMESKLDRLEDGMDEAHP